VRRRMSAEAYAKVWAYLSVLDVATDLSVGHRPGPEVQFFEG
jgi:hypothetical protein